MTLRVATTILAVLIGAGPAPAQWRDAKSGDEERRVLRGATIAKPYSRALLAKIREYVP
jgi:hypothetical protein